MGSTVDAARGATAQGGQRVRRALAVLGSTLCLTLVTACSVELVHDIDEQQANETIAALQANDIEASKERKASGSRSSYTLSVSRSDAPRAWRVLRERNLPRARIAGVSEVFDKSTLVPSATQQRAMMRHALAGELARTLQAVEGVHHARVHVVLPRRDPLAPADAPRRKPRAAVLLRVGPKAPLSAAQVRRIVVGGVEDLEPDAVRVVITKDAGGAPPSTPAAGLAAVGPFRVAAGSRGALVATLVAGVVVLVGLALALLLLVRKNRRLAAALQSPAEGARAARSPDVEASLGLIGTSLTSASSAHRSASRASRHRSSARER